MLEEWRVIPDLAAVLTGASEEVMWSQGFAALGILSGELGSGVVIFVLLVALRIVFALVSSLVYVTRLLVRQLSIWVTVFSLFFAIGWLGWSQFGLEPVMNAVVGAIAPEPQIEVSPGVLEVKRTSAGQFKVRVVLNGAAGADFVVDTGATHVMLRRETAREAGIDLAGLDYSQRMVTAGGSTHAARVFLERISMGSIEIRNVHAFVSEPQQPGMDLLGMNVISRMASFEISQNLLKIRAH